jgi:hypothetical protein
VLDIAIKDGKWEDYYQIRNETWRQLRQYERDMWGMSTRAIVRDGLNAEISTGIKFDSGFDGVVELVGPEKVNVQKTNMMGPRKQVTQEEATYWVVRREDGTNTRIADGQVPADIKARYNGVTPEEVEAQVAVELDNIASAQPFAEEAQALLDAPTPTMRLVGPEEPGVVGTLRLNGNDTEVKILGKGEDGNYRYRLGDGSVSEAPMENLMITDAKGRRRNLRTIETLRKSEQDLGEAQEIIEGAKEARDAIRAEWDKVAKASNGYLSIDAAIRSYARNGIVAVSENKFEDLYGTVIAGVRIEGQNDIDRLLQDYYDLRRQVEAGESARDYAKLDLADAKKNFEQIVKKVKQELNLGGGANQADLQKVSELTTKNTTAMGGIQAPEISLAAMHAKDQLQNIYDYVAANLDSILSPSGALSQGQSLRAVDDFRRTVLPAWDNAKYVASEFGNRMRSFTMVDFANNTRLDEIAGVMMPYGFWFSRSIKNSVERAIFEPHIWRRVMQAENGLKEMQQQRGDPARYQGSIPIDLGNGTVYYLRISPSKYWPTAGVFTSNDYADPESANNAFTMASESLAAANAAPFPWIKAASQVAQNVNAGDKWNKDIYPMSYIPQGRVLGWASTYLFGHNVPGFLRPGYYEYNVARELTTMTTEGEITSQQAQWAQDMLRQMKTGEGPLPEQAAMKDELIAILNTATERAAQKELVAAGSSLATGIGVRPFDTDEKKAMEASQLYRDREYNPNGNQYGGETAQNATFEQYPELGPKFSQGSVINEDMTRPGASAAKSAKIEETTAAREALYAAGDAGVDAYLAANPGATKKQIADARRNAIIAAAPQFIDKAALDAFVAANPGVYFGKVVDLVTGSIEKKWPSADLVQAGKEKAYNPLEQKDNFQQGVLNHAAVLFPYPTFPEGGTPAQIAAYMKQKTAIDAQRDQWMTKALTQGGAQLVTAGEGGWQPWKEGVSSRTSADLSSTPEEAKALIAADKDKYKTEAEKKRLAEIEGEQRAKSAEWGNRRASVADYFGTDGAKMFDEYYALPKGAAREEYIKNNPVMRAINLYAYNKAEITTAMGIFGDDALGQWALAPAYADTEEARKARSDYWDKNPKAYLFNAWLNGRPTGDDDSGQGEGFTYNFGKDYNTALEMFGADIWTIAEGYKRGWNGTQKRMYFEKHPQLSAFMDWWNENLPKKEGATASGGRSSGGGGGFGGGYSQAPKGRTQVNIQPVYGREMARGLAESTRPAGYRPSQIDLRWMEAGRSLRPGKPEKFNPTWIRGIKV